MSETTGPFDSDSEDDLSIQTPEASLERGQVIDHYRLMHRLGRGGQGEVWLADQNEPVRRQVAIKFLRTHNLKRDVRVRFEMERQALAMMDHPHIAKIFDMGIHAGLGPYFAMEYCAGQPITSFCDERRLPIGRRLELFIQVCQAVHHAHQKGVIHRDIKPSNVMVVDAQQEPNVKVIDFGLAKAAQSQLRLTEKSVYTEVGSLLGTYKYMSPEQASGNNTDIDTRTDIYSLGVLLYELLTGTTPMDDESLRGKSLDEVVKLIRQQDPMLPSRRLSDSHDSLTTVSSSRQVEPRRLPLMVRGDLDWIVMKALEKDRSRRYESANHLLEDIQRHLRGEPVMAAPPSTAYKLRKLLRRYRVPATVASILLLSLCGGVVGTSIGFYKSYQAQKVAERSLEETRIAKEAEVEQRAKAVAMEKEAREKLELAEGTLNFFLYDVLMQASGTEQANRGQEADANLTVREAIHRADKAIDERFETQPLTNARIRDTVGEMLRHMDDLDRAIVQLEKACKTFDAELGPTNSETLEAKHRLAMTLGDAGRLEECAQLFEQLVEQTADQPESNEKLNLLNNLAILYGMQGNKEKSCALLEKAVAAHEAFHGKTHADTLRTKNNLAVTYGQMFNYERAVKLLDEVITAETDELGPTHSSTLSTRRNLATGYREMGKLDDAMRILQEILPVQRKALGEDDLDVAMTLIKLSEVSILQEDFSATRGYLKEALAIQNKRLAPDHPDVLQTRCSLALLDEKEDHREKAVAELVAVYQLQAKKLSLAHQQTQSTLMSISRIYFKLGDYQRSSNAIRSAIEAMSAAKVDNWLAALAHVQQGECFVQLNQMTQAEAELKLGCTKLLEHRAGIPFSHQDRVKTAIQSLVEFYQTRGDQSQADQWLAKLN